MTVTWVLENDVFSYEQFENMIAHLELRGIPYHVVRVKPFVHEIEGEVPDISGPCVVYGSIGAQKLAQKHGWYPGVWTGNGLNETVLADRLGYCFLNWDLKRAKFRDVLDTDVGDLFFIKPDTDTKEFAGTVLSRDRFDGWLQKMLDTGYLDTNVLDVDVILSGVKVLGCEWRTIIVDGKVSDYSCYRQYQMVKPERWAPQKVLDFAAEVAAIYSPYEVFTLDVAETEMGLKCVEYNSFNSSGFYRADIAKIIDDVTACVERNYGW